MARLLAELRLARVGPRAYAIAGLVLFGVKHVIDRVVTAVIFERPWSWLDYWVPSETVGLLHMPRSEQVFFITLLGIAVPFLCVGIVLTLRRLRSTGLSPAWVLLFFVPVLNVLMFVVLSRLPARAETDQAVADVPGGGAASTVAPASKAEPADLAYATPGAVPQSWLLERTVPQSKAASALFAMLVPLPPAVLLTVLAAQVLRTYGWGLFVGLPFVLGTTATVLHGYRVPRTRTACLGVAAGAVFLWALCLVLLAFEGVICVIMASPLILGVTCLGAAFGWSLQSRGAFRAAAARSSWMLGLVLAALMGVERAAPARVALWRVDSAVDVAAAPAEVWRHVVSFPPLPPPRDWLFRLGVAYPTHAEISGSGVGTVRQCCFSTGRFVEPIDVWDEPRRLAFRVTQQAPPMREWSPYGGIQPPHLHGFMVSERGQFELIAASPGRTRLRGSTWYRHRMWPAAYWRLWSDWVIERIHHRVLVHVRDLAETTPTRKGVSPLFHSWLKKGADPVFPEKGG